MLPVLPDECFAIQHDSAGTLGMVNQGPNTNGSQFYITLQPTPWMDKQYVAFGYVVCTYVRSECVDTCSTAQST